MDAVECHDVTVRRGRPSRQGRPSGHRRQGRPSGNSRQGGSAVLAGLSASWPAGRITGLLGPSGAGKTTLIRAVVGVQRIGSGSIRVFGRPAGSPDLRARIGYVTQAPAIYDDLTVAGNVAYFAAVAGRPRHRADAAIAEVGLSAAAGRLGRVLSGGQRSRTSLACALVTDPELLVLDEPTVGQDPVLREELWAALRRRVDAGATIVLSSHVMAEASRCDELVLLREGRVIAHGSPAQVSERAGTNDMDAAFLALIRSTPVGPEVAR